MSSSPTITLSSLALCTPDGRLLLDNLDLVFGSEKTGLVGRNGIGKSTLLKTIANEVPPHSGRISTVGKLALLSQAVESSVNKTVADLFEARAQVEIVRRAERGEATLNDLAAVDWTLENRIVKALANVGLHTSLERPLADLSGGQVARACLAALTFAEPDFLLLDEPTNNLDRDGRAAVISLLSNWSGGSIVVSHDRELLDTMDAIVELNSLGARRYGGNWSTYRDRKAAELEAEKYELVDAEKRLVEIDRKAQRVAERKMRSDSRGARNAAGGGMPGILAGGRKDRSQDASGGHARLAARRHEQARSALLQAREKIEVLQPFSVTLASTCLSPAKQVLELDRVKAGYDADRPVLQDFSLSVVGPERIAITGPNGAGKSTLLKILNGTLRPWGGSVTIEADVAMLDQTVSLLNPTLSIFENFRQINPEAGDNACRELLARFMFRADAARQKAGTLSGGQMLRAGLACVLGRTQPPALLILDEPTNHLDLDSLEVLEAGLFAYDGALLVVSHDEAFLEAIGIARRVQLQGGDDSRA